MIHFELPLSIICISFLLMLIIAFSAVFWNKLSWILYAQNDIVLLSNE